ncbi:MAG: threonine/serine exporter ThrE family protein [Huintestinicola sp.]
MEDMSSPVMNEVQLADITADICCMLIKYGAEIYRVEDTAQRICSAYGHPDAEIYATPANFIITVKDNTGYAYTDTKSVSGRETNLDRVGKINELSRFICSAKPCYQTVRSHIHAIKNRKVYSQPVIYLSYAVVGASFTVFFGGSLKEALCGAFLALTVKFITDRLEKFNASTFLNSVVCSMAISVLALLITESGITSSFDKMIIGASMTLVPGVAITNCMRDFIAGDFMSGIYTMTEALLTAVGLAVGAGSAVAASLKF